MHRETIDVYERVAADYAARRAPRFRPQARAFGRRIPPGRLRADLDCGPGRYAGDLGEPVVAVDAAAAMLELVPEMAPRALRVRADLEALPFRRGGLDGAWANLSYQHIPSARLPLALAQLHGTLSVGAPAEITVMAGTGEGPWPNDDFPGRMFARWAGQDLDRVLLGAGFGVESITADGETLRARVVRRRTLPDVVGPGMRLLLCGLNPSVFAADAGVSFARPGNRFWPAALAAGLVDADRDPWRALADHAVGFTDLVKRASARADQLTVAEYRAGAGRLGWLVSWLRPEVVCFVGLAGWRAAVAPKATPGPQPDRFAGVPAYVMPSTSGANAATGLSSLVEHLRAARALAGGVVS